MTAIERLFREVGYTRTLVGGFDTGTRENVGYGLVTISGEYFDSGVWTFDIDAPVTERLVQIYHRCYAYIALHKINVIAWGIEEPWVDMGKKTPGGSWARKPNPQVGLKLAKTWGVMAGALSACGVKVEGVSHNEAKMAMTDSSRADKETVLRFTRLLKPEIVQYDESDALAVALALRLRLVQRVKTVEHGQ